MEVSSRRLALVLHRHLAEHGLLSFLSLLGAFQLKLITANHGCCSACFAARCYCMTAGWGETEVLMDISSRRLARVLHRHLAEHGLLSFLSLLRAFRLHVTKRNQATRISCITTEASRPSSNDPPFGMCRTVRGGSGPGASGGRPAGLAAGGRDLRPPPVPYM